MRILVKLPKVEPNTYELPETCPYGCGCRHYKRYGVQGEHKPLRDPQYTEVVSYRYQCVRCGRTFRVYPRGVSAGPQSDRLKGMTVLLYVLGMSYGAIEDFTTAMGCGVGKTTAYNLDLLGHTTLALFCSSKAPAGIVLQVHDLAQLWRVEGPVIISGFHSSTEQEALVVLLRGPQPVIICPARSLTRMRLKSEYKVPLAGGRLLLLSPFAEEINRATLQTAYRRNCLVAALADVVLIAHAQPGSKTAQLVQEAVGWGKPVFTLEHEANQHLALPYYNSQFHS